MVRIIDCSVAIKWFVAESGRAEAMAILRDVMEKPENFAVPELFYFELAHSFYRVLPKPTSEHMELCEQLLCFGIHRFSMTRELIHEIRAFQKLGLSGYDGAYVALAKLTKGKWVTCDEKAHKRIQHLNLSQLLCG